MLKTTKQIWNLNEWYSILTEPVLILWIEQLFPNLLYRLNVILFSVPLKIPAKIFAKFNKFLKFVWKGKRTNQIRFEKEDQSWHAYGNLSDDL